MKTVIRASTARRSIVKKGVKKDQSAQRNEMAVDDVKKGGHGRSVHPHHMQGEHGPVGPAHSPVRHS